MSLSTFKKKSIHITSRANKRSGKPTNEYWLYQGPYGINQSLSSTIFKSGLSVNDFNYMGASNSGFSVSGSYRNVGGVGQGVAFSKSSTPYRGIHPKGWGGTRGRYPDGAKDVVLNIMPVYTGVAIQNSIIKPPVLSNNGMLARRYRWIKSGKYPNFWVQPNYTGNLTDTNSQGLYIQNKTAESLIHYDTNTIEKYSNYYKNCGPSDCKHTPSSGYTRNIQQTSAPYTKTVYRPIDSSEYSVRIQQGCRNITPLQEPYPYAVQPGRGILSGGINGTRGSSGSCNPRIFV